MPTVPTYDAPQVRATLTPNIARAPVDVRIPAGATGAGLGQGLSQLGEAMQKAQDEADALRAEDAYNRLRARQLEIGYGPEGAFNVQGEAVFKRASGQSLADETVGKYQQATGEIADGLASEPQKRRFRLLAERGGVEFLGQLRRHEAAQGEAFRQKVTDGVLAVEADNVAKNWGDDGTLAQAKLRARDAAEYAAMRAGLPADLQTLAIAQATSKLDRIAITAAATAGDLPRANALYAANQNGLTAADRLAVEKDLKPANAWGQGKAKATEAWGMLQAGKPAKEVEAWLVENSPDKDTHAAAQSVLAQYEQAAAREDRERRGGLYEAFGKAPTRATMNALLQSPEYRAMSDGAQGEVSEYLRHQVQVAEDHARVLSDRKEAKERQKWLDNPEALATFDTLVKAEDLGSWSPAVVASYTPMIGKDLVKLLEKARKNREGGAAAFKIDPDLLKAAIPPEVKGEKLRAFNGIVESALITWKEQNPGKKPSLEEQKAIARSANQEYLVANAGWFGTDVKGKLYELKPMPEDFRRQAYAMADQMRRPRPNEEQLLKAWARNKEAR